MPRRQLARRDEQDSARAIVRTLGFVDREAETRRLRQAILHRESLMICGPAGIGKTALVSHVLAHLPAHMASGCLYLWSIKDLQDLLQQLIRQLYRAKDLSLRRHLHADGVSVTTIDAWLKGQPSSRLRGALYRTVEVGDYRLFLDHLPPPTHAVAKVIKELFWMRRTPVYLLPLAPAQQAFERVSRFFYWGDQERLVLGPLPASAARKLMESCIQRVGLSHFDLEDFREQILELSGRVPGVITTMCDLASHPRYQFNGHIKAKTVYIDYVMRNRDVNGSERRVAPGSCGKR
jgi:hypothetical protein